MYKNLFFDLDNTLYDFSTNSRRAYKSVFDKLNYKRFFEDFDAFYEIYEKKNIELWALYGEKIISKEDLNRIRFNYPLQVAGINDSTLADKFCESAFDMLSRGTVLMPFAKEVLAYLKPVYNLYIVSNGFKELQVKKMRSAGIDGFFDGIILSEDIMFCKPNREIFEYALKVTGSEAHDSLMIGDNYDIDILGAAKAGIDQVYYHNGESGYLPVSPTFSISSLNELKGFL